MIDLTLIIFSLRSQVKELITEFGYKMAIYLLLNYFIDQYFYLKGWSWNDFFTVIIIGLEYTYCKLKK